MAPMIDTDHKFILAVQHHSFEGKIWFCCCLADLEKRQFGVDEVLDDESCSSMEAALRHRPGTLCLLPPYDPASVPVYTQLERILRSLGCVIEEGSFTELGDSMASVLTAAQSMTDSRCVNTEFAPSASHAVARHLGLLENPYKLGSWTWIDLQLSQYMKMDMNSLKALSIEPPSAGRNENKSASLLGLLDRCCTAMGSRLLAAWLRQPLLDLSAIRARHNLVGIFMHYDAIASGIEDELKSVPDLPRLADRFERGSAQLEDVIRSYQTALRLPIIIATLRDIALQDQQHLTSLSSAYLDQLVHYSALLQKLQDLVETTVDLDALDRHEFLIRPDFDSNLGSIRSQIDSLSRRMEAEHLQVAQELKLEADKKLKLENHSTFGFSFRLTRTEASVIRNRSEYRELQTTKAGVFFTTKLLSSLKDSYTALTAQYQAHQSALVKEVITIAASYSPVLESLGKVLSHLDVILSFAQVSLAAPVPYVAPLMFERGFGNFELTNARHPCMEVQNEVRFIPNDVTMLRTQSEFNIITGANMGGKSTFIRMIGVIAVMAQVGCFVPCATAKMTIFDAILVRVGAGDSQLKGLSTFMAEMLESGEILKKATKDSLVIIDELGRGTSTTDGYGLAYGISEHLVTKIGCFSLFATHFHELTVLSQKYPTVENLHVTTHLSNYEAKAITLLYKVVNGPCSQSFGIHVAEMAQFPPSVVHMAKRKLADLELEIHELNGHRHEIDDYEQELRSGKLLRKLACLSHIRDSSFQELAVQLCECRQLLKLSS